MFSGGGCESTVSRKLCLASLEAATVEAAVLKFLRMGATTGSAFSGTLSILGDLMIVAFRRSFNFALAAR